MGLVFPSSPVLPTGGATLALADDDVDPNNVAAKPKKLRFEMQRQYA